MARKFGWLAIVVTLALSASAADKAGSISGYVKNTSGTPQMGAMVQVSASAIPAATVFTDTRGYYEAKNVPAGTYDVKVTANSFLPSIREDVTVRPGAGMIINITLNTLFEAIQLLPARGHAGQDEEDWKWTLRSTVNRPVLRVLDDGPLVVVSSSEKGDDKVLKARVAFVAGSDSSMFGNSGDMSTAFSIEKSMFSAGTLSFNGNVGYGEQTVPSTVLRASYKHVMPNGSTPEVGLTMRRFVTPELAIHNAALQALALSLADNITLADRIDLNFGTEFQTIQFARHISGYKPFGSVDVHVTPNTVVEYQYATSEPNLRDTKGFDSAPADLSESGPRVSLDSWQPVLEKARHQEVSVSQRSGKNRFQVALYSDHISNPAVLGVGEVDAGDFLPDVYSGTFYATGSNLDTNGMRFVYQRKVLENLTATLDYAYGGVLDVLPNVEADEAASYMRVARRHAMTYKASGEIPRWKTRWIASYKWTSGPAITPVDLFNVSAGQADPYLNIFVRQPIPGTNSLPGHMEALIDVRNLLAQGYVPVLGQDGQTVYLVQSARAVRGGVSFTF